MEKELLFKVAKAVLIVMGGGLTLRFLLPPIVYAFARTLGKSHRVAISKLLTYSLSTFIFLAVLNTFGVDLKILLGAAGIFTVALGFASQTSASNLISGIFLVMERPFSIGDVIEVGDEMGEVVAIDLLSTRLRTYTNIMIRVPNETLMKSQIKNRTFYAIRRVDLFISVAFREDLEKVENILTQIVDQEVLVLDEPRPLFMVLKFGESSVDLQFSFWTRNENYLEIKNKIYNKVLEQFKNDQIEIPFPHRVIINQAKQD